MNEYFHGWLRKSGVPKALGPVSEPFAAGKKKGLENHSQTLKKLRGV
jgi:hypothetical protein